MTNAAGSVVDPMSQRKIPPSGINLFQLIYILIREYEEKSGQKALNLSLGNPDTVPGEAALELEAAVVRDPALAYHTYAEDGNLDHFAEGMVALHGGVDVAALPHLRAVPIAGIKTATALLPLACGLGSRRAEFAMVSNLPAYDIVGTWAGYLGTRRIVWPLRAADNMRLDVPLLRATLERAGVARPDLIHVIRPGNPAAVGCSRKDWDDLIALCVERGIRLVNDAAYVALAGDKHVALAAVAKDHPELEWVELYSVSKSFSDPGARLGAMVGSRAFVEDFIMIKGNTDSGPVPGIMGAYGRLLANRPLAERLLGELRDLYGRRLAYLVPTLKKAGLRPACETEAGFFTLWNVPRRAAGEDVAALAQKKGQTVHEAFNRLVIDRTGIVGVHFAGPEVAGKTDPLIRYAVCTDVLDPAFQKRFEAGLAQLAFEY